VQEEAALQAKIDGIVETMEKDKEERGGSDDGSKVSYKTFLVICHLHL